MDQDNLHMKFSALNVDFSNLKSRPSRFKEACARGCQRGYRSKKWLFICCCLAWKWLQIGRDMLLNIASTGDELLRIVNIDDLEW